MEIKNPKNLKIELFNMAPEFTNSVLVSYGDKCIIFDAWGRARDWLGVLRNRKLDLMAIYSTHGHPDHIAAAPDLVLETGAKWFLNEKDFDLIGWGDDLLNEFGLKSLTRGVMPDALQYGNINIFDNVEMNVIACPGHTRGGVSFYVPDLDVCIVGDTLFADSVGRTDLPGGDIHKLKESISNFYKLNLPNETVVIPGHDRITTIAKLKIENPFYKMCEFSQGINR